MDNLHISLLLYRICKPGVCYPNGDSEGSEKLFGSGYSLKPETTGFPNGKSMEYVSKKGESRRNQILLALASLQGAANNHVKKLQVQQVRRGKSKVVFWACYNKKY